MVALLSRVLSVLILIRTFDCDYIPKWSCDFENGLCHWLQAIDDENDFSYIVGGVSGWGDHTTKSPAGKFLYLHFGSRYSSEAVTAKLISPILMPNNGSCKMALHYKTYNYLSSDKAQVFVNMILKGDSGRIHRKPLFQSLNSSVWARQDVILQSNVEFQVEIVGMIKAYIVGRIGIDDIWFTASCQTIEKSPIRVIKLESSPSHNFPAGVFYENLNGSWSAICSEDRARSACNLLGLKDVKIGNHDSLYGHVKSGQEICLQDNITVPTYEVCNNESSCRNMTYWECKQDYISICPKLTHIACTSAVKNPVCISHHQICDCHRDCPGGEDESNCLAYNRCDFQKDMCDWVAAKHSFFEWERYNDRVLGKFCVNVHSYRGHRIDGIVQLRMKYLVEGKRNGTCTIRFMYRTRGLLRMVLKEKTRNETVWSVTSTIGIWRRAFVELPDNRSFQVLFEAIISRKTNYYFEHFGLADISFSKDCIFSNHTQGYPRNDSSIFVCRSGEAIEKNFVCDFKVECFDGSDESNCSHTTGRCDFDSSFCDWQVGSNVLGRLRRWKGPTWTSYMSPAKDHTNKYKSGYYVYLDAAYTPSGTYGRLISRTMQISLTKKCTFRWFYHMWSIYFYSIGKLSVIYKDIDTRSERTLWQIEGNQGSGWKYGSVTFDITSFRYKIIIKIERGTFYSSIAIDDVSFAPECLQTADGAITVTKYPNCSSVKYNLNGTSASVYQFGSGRVFCDVTIRTDPRLRISLYAEFFNTDSNKTVLVNAGRNGSVIYGGYFTGSIQPFSLISSTNVMNIRVPPLDGNGSHSFTFNITATYKLSHPPIYHSPSGLMLIHVIRECGGFVSRSRFTSSGTVKPRKPFRSNYYYNNERCIFRFVASNGYRIKFTFNMFDTEARYDYVQILNNGIIGQSRFTGSHNVIQFISKRSHVEMLFVTDGSIRRRGFSLSIMSTDEKASAAKFILPTPFRPWFTVTPWFPNLSSTESPYIEWPSSQRANKTTSIILVSTLPTSIVITIGIVYVAYIYIKKKYRISTRRSEAVVARRNQARSGRNADQCAYFVNPHPVEGILPSYEDATKDRVFFFNTLQEQQKLQLGIGEAPPLFNDALNDLANGRPPQYTEIAVISDETRAESSEVSFGHIGDYSDLMVALPDVESTDRPLSVEGRPTSRSESRNSYSLSVASLRNSSPELLLRPLIVTSLRNSEREGHRESRTSEVQHEGTSEEHESSLENRMRSEELRGLIYGIEDSIIGNGNQATDLPPSQRIRAYDNRGADST